MNIFVEGYPYSKVEIEECFGDLRFSVFIGGKHYINYVGYFFNTTQRSLNYILPKVLVKNNKLLGMHEICGNGSSTDELSKPLKLNDKDVFSPIDELLLEKFLLYFQSSLFRYRKEVKKFTNQNSYALSDIQDVLLAGGIDEVSILEIIHKIIRFSKRNKIIKHYVSEYSFQSGRKNVNWSKTVSKSLPCYIFPNGPIYKSSVSKRKTENPEFELIKIYLMIMSHISTFYYQNIFPMKTVDTKMAGLLKGREDRYLRRIRKIKKNIFNDLLREMALLCEMFLEKVAKVNPKHQLEDLVLVKNYNIIFERMVDLVFSDKNDYSNEIIRLKSNDDGKIIDHIFGHRSLIGENNIFYIGDSKYYKETTHVQGSSLYKQFTYAKNIIQFNINYMNANNDLYLDNYWYRDEITEGYNLTPNFFIRGDFNNKDDFDHLNLVNTGQTQTSFHYKDRFFDRDSLRIFNYTCNFLNLLRMYSIPSKLTIRKAHEKLIEIIREDVIKYLNSQSEFSFYFLELDEAAARRLVDHNFKLLNGKSIFFSGILLLAKHHGDSSLDNFLRENCFESYSFS